MKEISIVIPISKYERLMEIEKSLSKIKDKDEVLICKLSTDIRSTLIGFDPTYQGPQYEYAIINSNDLIKQLTEENERLFKKETEDGKRILIAEHKLNRVLYEIKDLTWYNARKKIDEIPELIRIYDVPVK